MHTIPSDFGSQEIQTETQAARVEREDDARAAKAAKAAEGEEEEAKAALRREKQKVKAKAERADNWLTAQFASLSDGSAGTLVLVNLAGVVGLSSYLGYRAWGLYEKGRLSWQNVGLGVGILAGVGVLESVFGGYLYKGKGKKN